VEKYGKARQITDDNTIGLMDFGCRIIKVTDKPSKYEIYTALLRQQLSCKRVLVLCYTQIACLVIKKDRRKSCISYMNEIRAELTKSDMQVA
jgi:hypothetical protein